MDSDPKNIGPDNNPTKQIVQHAQYDRSHRVIAVTGTDGFIGQSLLQQLEADARYEKILALDIRPPTVQLKKTRYHKIDLISPTADEELAALLKREKVDTVVHLAFLSFPTHNTTWAHELEAIGTLHMINACSACHIRKFILWSLTALYGPRPSNPNYLLENHRVHGIANSRFFADKLEAERLARQYGSENPSSLVTILRTAPIIGPNVCNYVTRYLGGPIAPVICGYDPILQFLHEQDAIRVFKHAIDHDYHGEFNIAADGILPLKSILAHLGILQIPVPNYLARVTTQFLWLTQLSNFSPIFLDFLRYLCVVETKKMKEELRFIPNFAIKQILTEFATRKRNTN